jgi:hypothetical protein
MNTRGAAEARAEAAAPEGTALAVGGEAALGGAEAALDGPATGRPATLVVGVASVPLLRRVSATAPTRIPTTTTDTSRIAGKNRPGDQPIPPLFRCGGG